jgi:hypothetical protein
MGTLVSNESSELLLQSERPALSHSNEPIIITPPFNFMFNSIGSETGRITLLAIPIKGGVQCTDVLVTCPQLCSDMKIHLRKLEQTALCHIKSGISMPYKARAISASKTCG